MQFPFGDAVDRLNSLAQALESRMTDLHMRKFLVIVAPLVIGCDDSSTAGLIRASASSQSLKLTGEVWKESPRSHFI
jgi:hypothetical protein